MISKNSCSQSWVKKFSPDSHVTNSFSVRRRGLVLASRFISGPNSFTGQAILELQGHGGSVVQDLLLQRCIELGARMARPGEFSERAFLNDKLDLAQAEVVADLIEAASVQAAKSAVRSELL